MASDDEGKLIKYLRETLKVENEVINRFVQEKIDESNVNLLTESQLKDLGITALGDRMVLRDAFKGNGKIELSREEKLQKMRAAIEQAGATRLSKRSKKEGAGDCPLTKKPKRPEKETLKFQFGWKHWDGKKYVQKKLQQGGGNRQFEVPRNASLNDCKNIGLGFFFPGGESPEGKQESMTFQLANFKDDVIEEFFIASEYKRSSGLTIPRIYLLSKEVEEESSVDDDDDDDDDDDFLGFNNDFPGQDDIENTAGSPDQVMDMISDSQPSSPTESEPVPVIDLSSLDEPCSESSAFNLIGTSEEREIFSQELERLVAESEDIDRKKNQENKIAKEEKEMAQLQELKRRRSLRVTPEPQKDEESLTVCVRHPSLGRITRRFRCTSKVEEVYDWVGSLSLRPRYFSFSITPGNPIYPSEDVTSVSGHVLAMMEDKSPLPLAKDDSVVSFFDGLEINNAYGYDDTLPMDSLFTPMDSDGNDLLILEDDKITSCYKDLRSLAETAKKELGGLRTLRTTRNTVYQDLLAEYENEDIMKTHIVPMFYDETGCGDGVVKEMYSIFWESFLKENCDGSSQCSIRLFPQMTDKYKIVGRIITHQFVQCLTFPVQLSRASMHQALFADVSEECLIDSFLKILPLKESEMLSKVLEGKEYPFPTDDVVDILDEYNVRTFPSQDNIKGLIKNVASMELVSRPYIALENMKKGMGPFWANVSKEMVDALYSLCEPTHSRVIRSLAFQPSSSQENRVFRWLKKYLMESDIRTVTKFLQFCTGSNVVDPTRPIALQVEAMSQVAMRPKAKTCFGVLTLPLNYLSYFRLKENLDIFLANGAWNLEDY